MLRDVSVPSSSLWWIIVYWWSGVGGLAMYCAIFFDWYVVTFYGWCSWFVPSWWFPCCLNRVDLVVLIVLILSILICFVIISTTVCSMVVWNYFNVSLILSLIVAVVLWSFSHNRYTIVFEFFVSLLPGWVSELIIGGVVDCGCDNRCHFGLKFTFLWRRVGP